MRMPNLPTYLISPPVGSWFGAPGAIRVFGSFTWLARPGRIGQVLRTVRPVPGGWVNAVGLRNPGIRSVDFSPDHIYSLAGIDDGDWERMAYWICAEPPLLTVELNLSCPNVHEYGITRRDVKRFNGRVIAKLPPTEAAWKLADICAEAGVEYLHFSNTIPSPIGGISGDALRRVNLPMVERAARCYPAIPIIAGGGIKSKQHETDYANAGARHFSISSGYLWWRLARVIGAGSKPATEASGRT